MQAFGDDDIDINLLLYYTLVAKKIVEEGIVMRVHHLKTKNQVEQSFRGRSGGVKNNREKKYALVAKNSGEIKCSQARKYLLLNEVDISFWR